MGRNGTQGKGKPGLKDKGFGAALIKRHQQSKATGGGRKEPTNMKSFLDESALVRRSAVFHTLTRSVVDLLLLLLLLLVPVPFPLF